MEESEPVATASETPLPGDEALVPPPPDPRAADLLQQLEMLAVGTLAGTVDLQVSGITAFSETVSGECTQSAGGRGFTADLSDGSVLQVDFGASGGTSVLRAPGIEVDQTLTDVHLRVDDGVALVADLLTGGTSEPSGHLEITGTCS